MQQANTTVPYLHYYNKDAPHIRCARLYDMGWSKRLTLLVQ